MTSFKLRQVRRKQAYRNVKRRLRFSHIFSPKWALLCAKALAHFCRQCSTARLCASFSAVRRRAVEHPQPECAGALVPNSAQIGPKLRPGELFYCQNSIKMRNYEDIFVSPSNVHQITWSHKCLIARDHPYVICPWALITHKLIVPQQPLHSSHSAMTTITRGDL